ncbi:Ral GTPase-activating protein subunit alpha-1 [Podila verticillata]|nr:Ral GTPase-activating protein subunit alpha-1 [Podila verticillata]
MDTDGLSQHPFDDFDHVRPMRPSQDLSLEGPFPRDLGQEVLSGKESSGGGRVTDIQETVLTKATSTADEHNVQDDDQCSLSQEQPNHNNVLAPSPLEHATHPSPYMSISFAYSTTTTNTNTTTDAPTEGSVSSLHPPLSVHSNASLHSLDSLSDSPALHPQTRPPIADDPPQQHPQPQRRQHGTDPPTFRSANFNHHNHSQENPTTPRRISSLTFLPTNPAQLFGSVSSPSLPQSPLQTVFPPQSFESHSLQGHLGTSGPSHSSSSLATSAAARISQAFSPLLASRRKSAIIEMPSTPESAKFPYSSMHHSSPGSLHSSNDAGDASGGLTSTQGQPGQGGHHFPTNFGKISSFSSPRSTRTRRTLPAGINYLSDDASHPSYATPPLTATAFHTGLAPHYATVASTGQIRESHQEGSARDSTIKSASVSSTIEKALKKAKVFLDDRAKPKARAASLWSFLDVTFEFDQAKFFQEHADQVFTVTHDSFWHQVDKFKQKPDRSNGLQSKEVLAVQKSLLLLRLIFLYLPDRMKNGWHRRPIANMLAQVLCHKNHPRIRIFGFRLLLLWINDQTVEYPEAIYLFSNAISLDLFMYDGEDLSIDHASISQTKLPTMSNGSTGRKSARVASQYLELAYVNLNQELLLYGHIGDGIAVGFGIDAGMAAARFMFDIVKKYYLVKVFPECARNLHLLNDEESEFGYKTCPPTILRTIIGFVIQYCLDSNEFNSPLGHTSPATPILKSIVYSSEINREMMHEIVRQGLSLPAGHPQYKDIVRGAVHIVGVWCLSGEEERPAFLRSSSGRSAPSASNHSLNGIAISEDAPTTHEPYSTANSFLQRYFQLLTKVFYDKPLSVQDAGSNSSSEALGSGQSRIDPDSLYSLYKDIIGLFRAIMSRGQIELDEKSWRVLLGSLLEIQRRVMNQPERYSTPIPPSSTDDLASYLVERWSLRLTHLASNEVFQVDIEGQSSRVHSSTGTRHGRKMSDKFRHSRYLSSKMENPLRHSIGGELLSTQGIPFSHPSYSLPIVPGQERSFRRANSVHYDPSKHSLVGSGVPGMNGSAMYAPTLLGHMGFMPSRELGREFHSTLKADVGECDEESFEHGPHVPTMGELSTEFTDEKLSRASSLSFHGPDSLHLDPIVERLSSLYGSFTSPDFIHISMKGRSIQRALSTWKNIICALGNPNTIQLPLVKTEVMLCLIDVWDLLNQTRTSQPANAAIIPPLYDFAPWFFEAAKSTNDGGIGLPAIYGGLCRMMSRRYDQDFDPNYYQMFYSCIMEGLLVEDSMIGHSIIANSSRLFNMSLPGSHVLVLPFLNAIRSMMLKDNQLRDGVSHFIRKQAIAILCSVCMFFYDFEPHAGHTSMDTTGATHSELLAYKLTFTRLVLDLTVAEANVKPLGKFWDTHSMLIQLCGMLVVNEWSSSLATCDIGAESELLLVVLDHLYWTEASIVQSAVEVISTLAGMYQDHEDNGWLILEMVLSHLLSAMQEHLKLFQGETRRGATISSFFRCLTEWLMVIPANIFSETELSRWVFELIEVGLSFSPEPDAERKKTVATQAKQHLRASKKRGPGFKFTGKSIHQHHRVMVSSGLALDAEIEQQAVKEAAEATLIHLVHFLNNIPSAFGPGTAVVENSKATKEDGTGSNDTKKEKEEDQMVFSLNNSILITLEDILTEKCENPRTRVTIRDETGLYSWDSEIFYKEMMLTEASPHQSLLKSRSRLSERFGMALRRKKTDMAGQLIWRNGVKVRGDDPHSDPVDTTTPRPSQEQQSRTEAPFWDGTMKGDEDKLDQLLQYIGDKHPDCLFDGKTPLNQLNNGMAMSTRSKYPSTIDAELNRHVQEENYYTRISDPQARAWYDKLVELRSSLIQSEEDVDEYQGSNTLMSLVNSNFGPEVSSPSFENEHPVRATSRRLSSRLWLDLSERRSESDSGDRPIQTSSPTTSGPDLMQTDIQGDDFSIAKAFQLVLPPEPERPLDSYQHSRLLLSHLGLLCFDRFQEHNFVLLSQSASLARDLKSLDKRSGRETFKIALLYVGPGQEGEQSILHNHCGSRAYNRFVRDLGWQVDLATHSGYLGGLERNGSNGKTAMYYCSSTLEIIFHEATRMPTDPDDTRQVKKKRHIGNDHVHIVWSEHSRPYDRNTIGGDFGNVLIVLSPVPVIDHGYLHGAMTYSELVSVEVIRDSNLPVFGPLVDGMVVPVSQLGRLVRQTAIHAAKLATAPPPLPPTPPSAGATGNGSGKSGFHASQASVINSAMQGHQYHQSSPSISATTTSTNTGPGQSNSTISASITSLVTSGIAGVSLSSGANGHGFSTNGSASSSSTMVHGNIGGGGTGTSQMVAFANGHPFKLRAQAIEQISKRHKMEKWTFQQFMERVFGYSTSKLQHR